jgi:hypothetical protein
MMTYADVCGHQKSGSKGPSPLFPVSAFSESLECYQQLEP